MASYALLQTNFKSVEDVVEFLFEPFEHKSGKVIMQHPFVGFNPTVGSGPANSHGRSARNQETQLRGSVTICILCTGPKDKHLLEEDEDFDANEAFNLG